MQRKRGQIGVVVQKLSADSCLHGVGLALMLMSEEFVYSAQAMSEEEVEELGDELWILCQAIGSVLIEHESVLTQLEVTLPDSVGAIGIVNPYYEGKPTPPNEDGGVADKPPAPPYW